ncbi:hypothetical protein AYI70_g720 [Smittium culicis]|uniref:Translocon-associated protein subunit beta n=1 Tax=Smittium culicis TaxID=133412 RepID=A0A1R1YFL6_9FUNG|nr:hypothetical protein AYI70_g720 [Smittium culicis]
MRLLSSLIYCFLSLAYLGNAAVANYGSEKYIKLAPDLLLQTVVNTKSPTVFYYYKQMRLFFYAKNQSTLDIDFVGFKADISEENDFSKVIETLMPQSISKKLTPGNQTFIEYNFFIRSGPGRRGLSVSVLFNDENASRWEMSPFNRTIDIIDDGTFAKLNKSITDSILYYLAGVVSVTVLITFLSSKKTESDKEPKKKTK